MLAFLSAGRTSGDGCARHRRGRCGCTYYGCASHGGGRSGGVSDGYAVVFGKRALLGEDLVTLDQVPL